MGENFIACVIVALIGLFCILCSIKNYNWFFENRKAKPFVWLFGRKGARIVYLTLGVFLVGLSVVIMLFL
ncbi:MAG: immunity 17 family protein [Synergistaceae bacterium]|jgi:hypothetical protein|nr:immunity 17 family protein [Synergistaceae bacterium]